MSNALNAEFLSDPLGFIGNRDHAVGGHDDLVQAMGGTRVSTFARGSATYRNAELYLGYIDALGVISFEFVPYTHGTHEMLVMRPVMNSTLIDLKGRGEGIAAPPSNPIQGHWFPYKVPTPEQMATAKTGGGPSKIMGYVDFKKKDPEYPFVFTGSMQGCHIVVTKSPAHPFTHFRAYHYASPGNFRGKAGDMAYHLWPESGGQVCAWFDDAQYGADPKNGAMDAFNFLHYSEGAWRIYTQMQRRDTRIDSKSAVVLFSVEGTTVSEPISEEPLKKERLLKLYSAWDVRCRDWAVFRFGEKSEGNRLFST